MRLTVRIAKAGALLLTALAVAMGAGGGVEAASASTPSSATPGWGPAQAYGSLTLSGTVSGTGGLPLSIACPSYGTCVAAGPAESGGTGGPGIMVETSPGQWGQPVLAPAPTGASGTSMSITSVACSSATSCVAVGQYLTASSFAHTSGVLTPYAVAFTLSGSTVSFGMPEAVALPIGAAGSDSSNDFFSGVACQASGCTAVGTYVNNSGVYVPMLASVGSGGTDTATAVAEPTTGPSNDGILTAISCPSNGACEAVGSYDNSLSTTTGTLESWTVAINGGVAETAQPATISGIPASTDLPPSPASGLAARVGLTGVSCPSAGTCTAVGSFEPDLSALDSVTLPISDGVPGQSSALFATLLQGISCTDASDCTAAGLGVSGDASAPITITESGGSWAAPIDLQGVTAPSGAALSSALANAVACTLPGVCVATIEDFSINSAHTAYTLDSYFAYSALPPTVTTSSLASATVGQAYTATLQSSGGLGTRSWSVTQGSLPAGLALDAGTGVISGTPTSAGQSSFTVGATNAGPPSLTGTASLSITVAAAPAGPAAPAAPAAVVKVASAKVSGSTATVALRCTVAACKGAFKLTGVEHLRSGKPTAVVARVGLKKRKTSKRTITLASGRYSIGAGATRVVKIKLNARAVRLLHRLHRISGKLTLTPAGAKTPALKRTLTFKYKR